jgi:hypothetical protein
MREWESQALSRENVVSGVDGGWFALLPLTPQCCPRHDRQRAVSARSVALGSWCSSRWRARGDGKRLGRCPQSEVASAPVAPGSTGGGVTETPGYLDSVSHSYKGSDL